jgi:outer membrane protein TolC
MSGAAVRRVSLLAALACFALAVPGGSGARDLPPLPPADAVAGGGENPDAVAAGAGIGIDEAVELAAKANPEIKTAHIEVERMMLRLHGVRLKYYPEFNIVAEAPRYEEYEIDINRGEFPKSRFETWDPAFRASVSGHLPTNADYLASFERSSGSSRQLPLMNDRFRIEFSQELLRKDPIWRETSLFKKQVWLRRRTEDAVDREFRFRVKSAFLDAVQARLLTENAEVRFAEDKAFAEESERKFQAGIIAEYALLDYRRDFEQSRSRMSQRRGVTERARNQMLHLLRLPFDSAVTFLEPKWKEPEEGLTDPLRMVESGLRSELQIAQVRYNLFENDENLSFLRNSLLPSVRARVGAEWGKIHDDEFLPDIESREVSAGLLVSVPLFGEQFEKVNNIKLEKLDQAISEMEVENLFDELARDVRNDLSRLREQRERYEIAKRIHDITIRDFELAKLRFGVGNVNSWDMIRSKNEFYSSLDDLVSLRFAALRTLAEIEREYPFLDPDDFDER